MRSSYLGKKQHQLLGKLLISRHPEVAADLLRQIPPTEVDFDKMPGYYRSFCALININPDEFKGPLQRSEKVEIRRLFVGIMIHLYTPQAYYQPTDNVVFTRGFTKAISRQLSIDEGYMCRFLREVIFMESIYEEFREKVKRTKEQLVA